MGRFIILAFLLLTPVIAGADPTALTPAGTYRVVAVIDGDTVVLNDGDQLRLVGLLAPRPPLDRPKHARWPSADAAKTALAGLVLNRVVELRHGGAPKDRHGRRLAHLLREDGLWVQGEMLRLGMARVYSFADNRALIPDMLSKEREARLAGRGIWSHPYYQIRHHAQAGAFIGGFQLVQGTVLRAERVGKRVYLNFEADWRRDFTASIDNRAMKLFEQAGLDPLTLEGRNIRVRGWIKKRNGPMIDISHPEQIEILER